MYKKAKLETLVSHAADCLFSYSKLNFKLFGSHKKLINCEKRLMPGISMSLWSLTFGSQC